MSGALKGGGITCKRDISHSPSKTKEVPSELVPCMPLSTVENRSTDGPWPYCRLGVEWSTPDTMEGTAGIYLRPKPLRTPAQG